MRRYGSPPKTGQTYIPRPGVYAILARGSDILLTHQMTPTPEYQLPGGGIDPCEHPLQALHREVFEETGWSFSQARRIDGHRRFTFMPEYNLWAEKICKIYVARPARKLGPPTESGHDPVWMPLDVAIQLVGSPGDRAALERYRVFRQAGFP